MKRIFSVLVILILTGCASTNQYDAQIYESKASERIAAIEHQQEMARMPTFEGECAGPCKFKMFDPSKLPKLSKADHYVGAHEANVQIVDSVMDNLVPMVGILGLMKFGSDALDAAGGGNSTIHNTSTINGDDNQINATAEMGGASSSVVGDAITDNSVIDKSRIDNADNSVVDNRINDSHDSTATPTVVEPSVHVFDPVIVRP